MTMQGPGVAGSAYDVFDAIAKASASSGGENLKDGKYVLVISEVLLQSGFKGNSFIVRFHVACSEPLPGYFELGGQPVAAGTPGATQVLPHAAGSAPSCAWVLNPEVPNSYANVKSFMLALTNQREAEFNVREAEIRAQRDRARALGQPPETWPVSEFQQACVAITSKDQPMRGALIGCTTTRKENQGRRVAANKGKLLVVQNWHYMPIVPAEVQARRVLLDKGLPILWTPPAAPPA
jgi:hypothetical protein